MPTSSEALYLEQSNSILRRAFTEELDELHRQLGTPRMREIPKATVLESYTHVYSEFLIMRLLAVGQVSFNDLISEFQGREGFNEWRALDAIETIRDLLQGKRRE